MVFLQISVTGAQAIRKIYNTRCHFLKYEWRKKKFGGNHKKPMLYDQLYELYSDMVSKLEDESLRFSFMGTDYDDRSVKISNSSNKNSKTSYDSDDSYDFGSSQIKVGFSNKKQKFYDTFDYQIDIDQDQDDYEIIEDERPTFKKRNNNGLTKILDKNLNMESKRMALDQKLLEFEQKKLDLEFDRLKLEKEKFDMEKEKFEFDKKKFELEKEKLEFDKKKYELDEKMMLLKMKELNLKSLSD